MLSKKWIVLLSVFLVIVLSASCQRSTSINKTSDKQNAEEKNITSLEQHLGSWILPNDVGDYYVSISKEAGNYCITLDMSTEHTVLYGEAVLVVNKYKQTATSVNTIGYDGQGDTENVILDVDIKWDEEKIWIKGKMQVSGELVFSTEEDYKECYKEQKEHKDEPFRDKNWPSNADSSWERFHGYGGVFFVSEYNNWVCNIGGSAIVWKDGKWTYTSKSGEYFVQYGGSDYFHIDVTDAYYVWNMKSLTGWVMVTPSGVVSCEEPQIFRDNVEKLKKSVEDSNLKSRIEKFRSMGFNCYEENGVLKCDTYAGILTYNVEKHEWTGKVDVYNGCTNSWEYEVDVMIQNAHLLNDTWFRYADGRYDKGVHSTDSDTDFSGKTYNICNYGIKGTQFYDEDILESLVGTSDFVGFWIYESQAEVDMHPPKR